MIRRLLFLTGLMLAAAVTAFCQSNESAKPSPPPPSATVDSTNPAAPPMRPRPKMPRAERHMGTLVRVDGTNLIIDAREPRGVTNQVSVPTDSQTEVRVNGVVGHLEDLKPGMEVTAMRMGFVGSSLGRLRVMARDPELVGTLVKVDGSNLVVMATQPGGPPHEATIAMSEHTRIQLVQSPGPGKPAMSSPGKPEDLKPGARITVFPPKGIAARISVTPMREGAPKQTSGE